MHKPYFTSTHLFLFFSFLATANSYVVNAMNSEEDAQNRANGLAKPDACRDASANGADFIEKENAVPVVRDAAHFFLSFFLECDTFSYDMAQWMKVVAALKEKNRSWDTLTTLNFKTIPAKNKNLKILLEPALDALFPNLCELRIPLINRPYREEGIATLEGAGFMRRAVCDLARWEIWTRIRKKD